MATTHSQSPAFTTRRAFIRSMIVAATTMTGLAVVTGCSPAPAPTSAPAKAGDSTKPGTPAASSAPAAKTPANLRFHARLGAEKGGDYWKEQIAEFEKANPTIKVAYEAPADAANYYPKIQSLAAGNQLGDAMWASIGLGLYHFFAARGILKSLTEYVNRDKYDLSVYWPAAVENLKYKGNLSGMPFKVHTGPSFVVYNKAMLEKAGLKEPTRDWTLDDLIQYSVKLTADTDSDGKADQFGFYPDRVYQSIVIFLRAFGAELMSPDGTKSMLDSDNAQRAIEWLYDFRYKHKAGPNPAQLQGDANRMFGSSKLAMAQFGMWIQPTLDPLVEKKFEYFATPIPKGPAGKRGSFFQADVVAMTGQTKNPDATWELLKFFGGKEAQKKIMVQDSILCGRRDLFDDPDVAKHTYLKPLYFPALEEAMPIHLAANYRSTDIIDTTQQTFDAIWLDKEKPTKEFMKKAHAAIQDVLNKPEP